ncbi:MAG TPA: hypothetical protein VMT92_06345 [Steroidobacteraceae bacterium]|nr:hypothetical protein [Steroidobacteraceae bacterium]
MASAAPGGRRAGLSWRTRLSAALVALALLAALYTYLTLSWSYSDGDRAGLLQKFSYKGWVCKTYEGELALYVVAGVQPEIWHFSVRDAALARQLSAAVGQRVQLHYTEHRGVPTTCFAETGYFVDRINAVAEPPPAITPAR